MGKRGPKIGHKKSLKWREAISRGHAAYKDTGYFYYTEEYKRKISKANTGHRHTKRTKEICRAAALRQHHGNSVNPLNEHQVPIASDRPDWLKDYI